MAKQEERLALDEEDALRVTIVRAIETGDRATVPWSDDDAAWASRAAGEIVGEGGSQPAFLAHRARLALQRIADHTKRFPDAVAALRWRPWAGNAILVAAFVLGVAIDRIGGSHRINVLALPILGVMLWNLSVYAVLIAKAVAPRRAAHSPAPLRQAVTSLATRFLKWTRGRRRGPLVQAATDWLGIAGPLYAARAARILHAGAFALALGLVAGLYVRGIAFEYRATWESTFLDAARVRAIVAMTLSPGALVTGIPIPGVEELAAIRAPASENAGRWVHLMSATLAAVVMLPRLLLALWAWQTERSRARRMPLVLAEPYFQRLLRGFRGGPVRVHFIPYSYSVSAEAASSLERIVAKAFGGSAAVTVMAPLHYGDEDALGAAAGLRDDGTLIALFNAAATPEREAHGTFLRALRDRLAAGGTLVALIDEGPLRARMENDPARIEARRRLWRELCAEARVNFAFVDLESGSAGEAAIALDSALAQAAA